MSTHRAELIDLTDRLTAAGQRARPLYDLDKRIRAIDFRGREWPAIAFAEMARERLAKAKP